MNEEWVEIKNFGGRYWVSNLGNVKSLRKILKPMTTRNQKYAKYGLAYGDGRMKYVMGHRLVAEAFLPNPENLPIVHHKDNNPLNNNVDNLEWCTYSQNTLYAIKDGRFTQLFGKKPNPCLKFSDYQIKGIKRLKEDGWSITEICDLVGCSRGYVSEVVNNKKRI